MEMSLMLSSDDSELEELEDEDEMELRGIRYLWNYYKIIMQK